MTEAPIGKTYGRLTVIREVDPHYTSGGEKKRKVLCRCVCGHQVSVRLAEILSGRSASCGCLKNLKTKLRFQKLVDGVNSRKHPLYSTWKGMRERCNDPNNIGYKYYGAKGIKVCEEWESSFKVFVEDMGPKPHPDYMLERINNDLGYFKGNVKWANKKEQMNHMTSNRLITVEGETLNVQQWSEKLGISPGMIRSRLSKGWCPTEALSGPKRISRKS